MPDPIDFRAVVAEAMSRTGLNAFGLANAADVPYSSVHSFLGGKRGLTDSTLAKVLVAAGVTVKLPRPVKGR